MCVLLQIVGSECCWHVNSFRRTNHALSELRHQYKMALVVVPARLCKETLAVHIAMLCCSHLGKDPHTMYTTVHQYRSMHVLRMLVAREWL